MKIIVVAPHADDETLGAGGYLLRKQAAGDEIHWLLVTNKKEEYGYSIEDVKARNEQIKKVNDVYKFTTMTNLELKPAGLDEYSKSELVGLIDNVFQKVKPDVVILPNANDVHSDHRVVFECAYACTKSFRSNISKIMMMEILSETDFSPEQPFTPNYFVNVEDYIEKKIDIMRIYEGEIKEFPFPRSETSMRALAQVRGGASGCKYAESFKVIKEIER